MGASGECLHGVEKDGGVWNCSNWSTTSGELQSSGRASDETDAFKMQTNYLFLPYFGQQWKFENLKFAMLREILKSMHLMIKIQCPTLQVYSRSIDECLCSVGHRIMVAFRRGPGPNSDLAISKNAQNSAQKRRHDY